MFKSWITTCRSSIFRLPFFTAWTELGVSLPGLIFWFNIDALDLYSSIFSLLHTWWTVDVTFCRSFIDWNTEKLDIETWFSFHCFDMKFIEHNCQIKLFRCSIPWLPLVDVAVEVSEGWAGWRSSEEANFSFLVPSDSPVVPPVGLIEVVLWLR